MKRTIFLLFILVFLSFLLGFLVSRTVANLERERAKILPFSIETRAVCEEVKKEDCYYKCHDEVFLIIAGKRMSVHKSDKFVCHGKDWVDPRAIKNQ